MPRVRSSINVDAEFFRIADAVVEILLGRRGPFVEAHLAAGAARPPATEFLDRHSPRLSL